ncbi:MAG TPA: hypothetical protein VK277_05660 [Acidimicrobiales bacterium]|nr:hypothetical protein [Acidimicrobiales bacterium]
MARSPVVDRGPKVRVTPARLRLASVGLAVLALVVGLVTALAAAERHAATAAAWQQAEPLVVQAQAIDTYLSDADTTAAGSFLQGQVQPARLRVRYTDDMASGSSSLAEAAQEAGNDPAVASSIRTISEDLPIYAGLVQTAAFNERQAYFPLAAAYIGEANHLMRTRILPAAAQLYRVENDRLSSDLGTADGSWLVPLAAVLLVVLLVLLIVAQVWMSRRFHRTFNAFLVGSTVVTLVLGIWFIAAVGLESGAVSTATSNGSSPVVVFTQARIGALRMTADDELTLLTRDSDPADQPDYVRTVDHIDLLLTSAASQSAPKEYNEIAQIDGALAAYGRVHRHIRQLDGSANPTLEQEADTLAASQLPAASSTLDGDLSQAIATSQQAFDRSMSGAVDDIAGLIWASAILSVLAAVLILVGFRPRIAEYR